MVHNSAKSPSKYLGEKKYMKASMVRPMKQGNNDQKFFLKMCKYMWATYTRGFSATGYGGVTGVGKSYTNLRLYSMGRQDRRHPGWPSGIGASAR